MREKSDKLNKVVLSPHEKDLVTRSVLSGALPRISHFSSIARMWEILEDTSGIDTNRIKEQVKEAKKAMKGLKKDNPELARAELEVLENQFRYARR